MVHGAQNIYLGFDGRPAPRTSFNSKEKRESNNSGTRLKSKKHAAPPISKTGSATGFVN